MCLMPLMKFERRRWTVAGELDVGEAVEQLLEHRPGSRAWPGWRRGRSAGRRRRTPRARCGVRVMSKRCGSSNTSSSRLAAMYQSATLSPSRIVWPRSSKSLRRGAPHVHHRRRVAQHLVDRARRAASGSSTSFAPLVGVLDMSASIPCEIRLRVVSLPGDGEQLEEQVELDVAEPLAFDLGLEQHADDVVARVARASRPASSVEYMNISVAAPIASRRATRCTRGPPSRSCGCSSRRSCAGPPAGRPSSPRSPGAGAPRRRRRRSRTHRGRRCRRRSRRVIVADVARRAARSCAG